VAPSIAALDAGIAERVVTANGFSKGYVMTGWRIGFAGGPAEMMKAIKLIVGQLVGSPNAIAQAAAVEALTGDQSFIEENAAIFQERRDIALQALQQSPGLRCHTPEGAFYLFADCSGTIGRKMPDGRIIETDEDFVLGAIEHAGVALVPGSAFGLSPYFRLSYSLDTAQLRIAMDRLRRYCNELI
jgi:aspartate aminotransferase